MEVMFCFCGVRWFFFLVVMRDLSSALVALAGRCFLFFAVRCVFCVGLCVVCSELCIVGCCVLCAVCYVLCAICCVLCAVCCVLCALCCGRSCAFRFTGLCDLSYTQMNLLT